MDFPEICTVQTLQCRTAQVTHTGNHEANRKLLTAHSNRQNTPAQAVLLFKTITPVIPLLNLARKLMLLPNSIRHFPKLIQVAPNLQKMEAFQSEEKQ